MTGKRERREPFIWESVISLLALIIPISLAIVKYETDTHIPILLGVLVAALIGLRAGFTWEEIQDGMLKGIANSLQAIVILCIIGILIGIWILSGVVPTMLYYGLKIMHPSIFLPATLIICSITSLATGTSWGTTGTIGIALIGIGQGLGFPLPVVGGAVISGAYFGDKMSPLSDTTNLAPAMVGTDLYTHIKHMTYTTGVAYGITLVLDTVLGFFYGGGAADVENINQILTGISGQFAINPLLLLPPVVVMVLAIKRIPAIPGITMGILSAALLGILFQGNGFGDLLTAGFGGYTSSSGVEAVDSLLTKGGMDSMSYTILIIVVAMMFGGIMENTNQLKVIVDGVLKKAESAGSLITATILTAIASNLVLCEQYMSIVMSARMYSQAFREKGLHPKNLSRAVEDSATVTACLVPWNSGGAYQSATLGVATFAYLPFAFFNWLCPIVSIVFGWLGITIDPIDEETKMRLESENEQTKPGEEAEDDE
ncbi:Na+/H+ antiporter NhaC [Desulfococcaceae bacterium HSG8]|nr:Na+/H+ antiporter NhaC [Desulfococcaceae bacterium HSG8]